MARKNREKKNSPLRKYQEAVDTGRITRRDFLQGMAFAAGSILVHPWPGESTLDRIAGGKPGCKNKSETPGFPGPNGNTDTVIENCHSVRSGRISGKGFLNAVAAEESDLIDYDLIIVGGGLSGLASAYYYMKHAGTDKRVLILENHEQVGGVARRNPVKVDGSWVLAPQGSYYAELPEFQFVAEMYDDIGIDLESIEIPYSPGAILFDEISHGVSHRWIKRPYTSGIRHFPISMRARIQIIRFARRLAYFYKHADWREELGRLDGMTLKAHIEDDLGYDQEVTRFYEINCLDTQGLGADAISAAAYYWFNAGEASGELGHMRTSPGRSESTGIYIFPGGNEGFARFILRAIIPDAVPYGPGMKDVITHRILTDNLDLPGNKIRMRLSATAVDVIHTSESSGSGRVRIQYLKDGEYHTVRGKRAILAGGGFMTRNIVSDLPEENREAFEAFFYSSYVVCNVFVNNSFAAADVGFGWYALYYDGFGTTLSLENSLLGPPWNDPSRSNCYTIWAPYHFPGLTPEEQGITGRQMLLSSTFEEIEEECLNDLIRLLGPHGFDPASDVEAVFINRWGHAMVTSYPGFAFGRFSGSEDPPSKAKKPYGRIAFAHTDLDGTPYMDGAFKEAYRAVNEIL